MTRLSEILAGTVRASPPGSSHIAQLDSLRAFAVLAVLFHHYGAHYFGRDLGYWALSGVKLFFVLSGFLITGILLRSRQRAEQAGETRMAVLRRFYARRFLRIFPVYYLVVAVGLALAIPPARDIAVWLLTYTLNIQMASQGWYVDNFAHFWSLSVEEQFYVCWPWLVLFCPWRHIPTMVGAVFALAPLYKLAYVLSGYTLTTGLGTYIGTITCLDSLGAGAALAVLRHSNPSGVKWDKRLRWVAAPLAAGVLLIAKSGVADDFGLVLHDTAQSVLFVWLIHASSRASKGISGIVLGQRPLQYIGKIAYGVYVYHPFVPGMLAASGVWIGGSRILSGWSGFTISTVLALALAATSWHLFEKPINNLKRHFDDPPRGRFAA